jgi:TRAP-type mannitol/chloroaromatic compound transport system permease large subunit
MAEIKTKTGAGAAGAAGAIMAANKWKKLKILRKPGQHTQTHTHIILILYPAYINTITYICVYISLISLSMYICIGGKRIQRS